VFDALKRWKCRQCFGTGEQIVGGKIIRCLTCDGTGNAMVDGAEERHKRELARIKKGKQASWLDHFR
jgi:hypothetical protein